VLFFAASVMPTPAIISHTPSLFFPLPLPPPFFSLRIPHRSMTSARLFTPGTEARLKAMKAAVAKFEGANKAPSSPSAAVGRVGKVVVEEVESLGSLLPMEAEELK
jgi:hypothetical protein